jgi:predicted glycoside hydrolase/deacetylase ChbG (UPF0249 family)
MLEHLLAGQERMMAKMKAEMKTKQERMEAKIEANNEKFEVLLGTLISWMDIHQARAETIQEEII